MNIRLEPQPPPQPTGAADIWPLVIADMRARNEQGIAKYGVPLTANNGRDPGEVASDPAPPMSRLAPTPSPTNDDVCTCGHDRNQHYPGNYGRQACKFLACACLQYEPGNMESNMKTLGQIGYEAYRAHTGGVSLATGQPIPHWQQLSPTIRSAWEVAGVAILYYTMPAVQEAVSTAMHNLLPPYAGESTP